MSPTRTTMRPTVRRCSIASSAAGSSSNGTSSPTRGRTAPDATSPRIWSCNASASAPRQEVGADRGLDRRAGRRRRRGTRRRARSSRTGSGRGTMPSSSASMPDAKPGEHVSAAERHAAERARRDVAADGVERDVDAAAARRLERGVDEVGGAGVDRRRRRRAARRSAPSRPNRPARSPWRPRPRRSCTAAEPTPPAAAWMSTVSPCGTPAAHVERQRREVERHEDRGRVGQRDPVGHRERHRRRRHRVLRVAAEGAARDRDDARARRARRRRLHPPRRPCRAPPCPGRTARAPARSRTGRGCRRCR